MFYLKPTGTYLWRVLKSIAKNLDPLHFQIQQIIYDMKKNQIRIIAGKFRSRKLSFPDVEGLRPSPDRVRETVFNWLAQIVHGSYCLDLFAGSGALGFEALSRGASKVIFVDSSRKVVQQLRDNQKLLKCDNVEIYCKDAIDYLKTSDQQFDIIFLDPPFKKNLWPLIFDELLKSKVLKPNSYIYIESPSDVEISLPAHWHVLKNKCAGKVRYCLVGF